MRKTGKVKDLRVLWKSKKGNPYLASYLGLATICCLTISVIFFYIHFMNVKETRIHENEKKAQLVLEDLESQMDIFEKVSVKVMTSDIYRPAYFRYNKYSERVLLEDFEQYGYYSALTDDVFLYYGGDSVFHAVGNTIDLDIYLEDYEEEGKKLLLEELSKDSGVTRMFPVGDTFFILLPFKASNGDVRTHAILGFAVNYDAFRERLQIVSGGMDGNITLYWNGNVLYHNQDEICSAEQKNVISVSTSSGEYTLCYLPEKNESAMNGYLPLQILLVLADVMLVMLIANYFAQKSYSPILEMKDRFREKVVLSEEEEYESSLDEIDHMMERMFQNNLLLSGQIREKQEFMHRQILQQLLGGSEIARIQSMVDRSQMKLVGPWYFVISISFEKEPAVTDVFLKGLQEKLEGLSDEEEKEYIYAICYPEKNQISVICSIRECTQKEEVAEYVCGVAESYEFVPVIGIGNVYQKLSRISASWLESMDNLNKLPVKEPEKKQQGYSYNTESLCRITAALGEGNEEAVMQNFANYIRGLENAPQSLLMQQYIFAEFLSEMSKVGKKHWIELPQQSISLIVTAKNVENFKEAARDLLQDLCRRIKEHLDQSMENNEQRICSYVNQHFTEYDLSIEKVAAELNTTVSAVRQAILARTGRMYKDYLIFLRIEYAKTLLLNEDMTVDEVCQKVGYSSISYFTKLFRETTGVTPAKYRTK